MIVARVRLPLLCAVALAGCAAGPDFKRPEPPTAQGYAEQPFDATEAAPIAQGAAQHFDNGADVPDAWWTSFESPQLSALVERALAHNPSIAAATASLDVARENVDAQTGAYWPQVGVNLAASREKDATGTLSPTSASGAPYLNLRTAQVSVAYALDVFGANRRQVENLAAQAQNQRELLDATRQTLAANVVSAAIQMASAREQIASLDADIAAAQRQLDLMQRQLELGAIAEVQVMAQRTQVAQLRAQRPALQKQFAQQRDLVKALAGDFPDAALDAFALDQFHLPPTLPLTLPSRLVATRPDIRAAEATLHAASAQVGVAVANRLPQITLSADEGSTATRSADLFHRGNVFWNVALGLTQPIFDGGTLKHRQRAAEAAYRNADAQYRSTVLAAFQNVADCLQALVADAAALSAAASAEQASIDSVAAAERQVQLGDQSEIALLLAQQALASSRALRIQAQAARLSDTAALFLALGGGLPSASAAE
jgi:NodT family efflux transporter outer membrane factor (OMF) lipoprotein